MFHLILRIRSSKWAKCRQTSLRLLGAAYRGRGLDCRPKTVFPERQAGQSQLRVIAPVLPLLPAPSASSSSCTPLAFPLWLSSHRLKSSIRTRCLTAGCLTRTFNSVNPSPISSTHWSPRRMPSACATAS